MKPRTFVAWSAPVLLLLALLPTVTAVPKTINVVAYLHEPFHIAPETINADLGDRLNVVVINEGQATHNMVFCGDGSNPSSSCKETWARTRNLASKEQYTLNFTISKPGTFDYYCDIPGHKVGGMNGTLFVAGTLPTKKSSPGLGGLEAATGFLAALAAAAVVFGRTRIGGQR